VMLAFSFKVIWDNYIQVLDNLVFAAMWRREQIHRKSWYSCHRLLWNKKQTSSLDSTWSFTHRVSHLRMIKCHLGVFGGLRKMCIAPEQSKLSSGCIELRNHMWKAVLKMSNGLYRVIRLAITCLLFCNRK